MSLKLYLDAISDFCQYKVKQVYIKLLLSLNFFCVFVLNYRLSLIYIVYAVSYYCEFLNIAPFVYGAYSPIILYI